MRNFERYREQSAISHVTNHSSDVSRQDTQHISTSVQQLSATSNVNNSLNQVDSTLDAIENADKPVKIGSSQIGNLYHESMNSVPIVEVI